MYDPLILWLVKLLLSQYWSSLRALMAVSSSANIFILSFFFQRDLTKRRENKARAELAGKTDKVNTLRQEIAENENQLNMAQVGWVCYKSLYISSQLVFHQQKFRKSLGIFYINPEIIRV